MPDFAGRKMNDVLAASLVGSALGWFDDFLDGAAPAPVFNNFKFPTNSILSSTLLTHSPFVLGFVVRPPGATHFGSLGDGTGRKQVLIYKLLLMGSATILIGCVPTYATIGTWAPVLLFALRRTQGFARGAEFADASSSQPKTVVAGDQAQAIGSARVS